MSENSADFQIRSNYIDSEFDEIEVGGYSLNDKVDLARTVIDDIDRTDSPLYKKFSGEIELFKPNQGNSVEYFRLPSDYASRPPKLDDFYTKIIKPEDTHGIYYLDSGQHIVTTVQQGALIVVDLDKRPYLKASMSECSFVAAKTQDNKLIAAHISYSQLPQLYATIEFMKDKQVDPKNIIVIASTGLYRPLGQYKNEAIYPDRATLKDYESMGINKKNILVFEYHAKQDIDNTSTIHHITHALVSHQFFAAYSANYLQERGFTYTRLGGYTNERVFSF